MVNSIGGNQSMLNTMFNQSVQQRPSPEEKFNEIDTDSSGGVSAAELTTLAEEISSRSGQTINTDEALLTFDSDSDGSLSQSEMDSMMTAVMEQFGPPGQSGGADPSFQQALSSYSENMGSSDLNSIISQIGSMPAPPPPNAAEQFGEVDENSDGGISLDELSALTEEMSEASGTTIDAEELLAASDGDGDGVLNEEEMNSLMAELHEKLGPPPPQNGNMGTMGDIFASYLEDADSDTLSNLVEIIGNHISSNSSNYTSGVDVQA